MDRLSSTSNLQVDFSDYNEEIESLGFKTTNKENKLIIDLMFQVYMERDLPLLHAFKINFTPSDLSVFSPANERNSYEAFIKRLNEDNEIALDDYKSYVFYCLPAARQISDCSLFPRAEMTYIFHIFPNRNNKLSPVSAVKLP